MKKKNPFLVIFQGAFPKNIDFSKSDIYHVKSFEDTAKNIELFEKHMYEPDFANVLNNLNYNSQANNVGMYYVRNSESKGIVYLLTDPFELFEKEYVMNEFEVILQDEIMTLKSVKKIN